MACRESRRERIKARKLYRVVVKLTRSELQSIRFPAFQRSISPSPRSRAFGDSYRSFTRHLTTGRAHIAMSAHLISDSLSNSVLRSTLHDRQRREERHISKVELLKARRLGMCEDSHSGRLMYTLAGKVFVYDPRTNSAVTCYDDYPERVGTDSGSKFVDPIMIHKSQDHEVASAEVAHENMSRNVIMKKHLWKSHTVLVVDMSGSMRKDDVDGARCRSDAVWTCVAKDFVKTQLDKESTTLYDLISVVLMRDTAEVVIRHEPTDWVLYNKLVDMREWKTVKPEGHGCYQPALMQARNLLQTNELGSCALSLFLFSDGKPSDEGGADEIIETMGEIASVFGRRLSVRCVGLGGWNEDFSVLENMVYEARAYGAVANFDRPSLAAASLSCIVSNHISSLISTKTELTAIKSLTSKTVRTDIRREHAGAPEDRRLDEDWRVFRASDEGTFVDKVWMWDERSDDFCQVKDRRCWHCFEHVADRNYNTERRGRLCPGCQACYFCSDCLLRGEVHDRTECLLEADRRRKGALKDADVKSYNVAWKRTCFGEGAERLAYKFRFLGRYDEFIGPVMVAKESRFVDEDAASPDACLLDHRRVYHSQFMRTQALASRFAKKYNKWLDQTSERNPALRSSIKKFPRIRFVKPLIFELVDGAEKYTVLVEPFIEGTYKKYNGNFGNVAEGAPFSIDDSSLPSATIELLLGRKPNSKADTMDVIEEMEDEENEEGANEDEDDELDSERVDGPHMNATPPLLTGKSIPDEDFMHAFSHYTYHASNKRYMVVDLQGSLKIHDDGTRSFILTDPAVHQRKSNRMLQDQSFGRTDLGEKGIKAFFQTHVCNDACRFLELAPIVGSPLP